MLLIDIGNSRIKSGVVEGAGVREFAPVAWRERPLSEVWSSVLGALPPFLLGWSLHAAVWVFGPNGSGEPTNPVELRFGS